MITNSVELNDDELKIAIRHLVPQVIIVEKNGARRCPTCLIKHFNPNWNPDVCECGQMLIKVEVGT